jgi:DNA-binding transcriptional regulator YdaS (Cro superfamily)
MGKAEDTPIHRAAKAVGGFASLAGELGISRQAIYQWRRIPAERIVEIEKLTGVPRHELRPDLYPQVAA